MGLPEGFKPLLGTEEAAIDDKGRIIFSKKKRDRLGESFVVTVGPLGCLEAYPELIWNQMLEELYSHKGLNFGRAQYARLLLGSADDDLKFDAQGRVVLPAKLRRAASLEREVTIVGCGDHVEIWDRKKYEQYENDPDGVYTQRALAMESAQYKMEGKWPELPSR